MRRILWAEDNHDDQFLIRVAVNEPPLPVSLAFVDDGVLLLDALEGGTPDLVVLDLKMPRLGGLETLRRIRAHPAWSRLPVAIFSAGDNPHETQACRDFGVLDVVQKPVGLDRYAAAVRGIVQSPLLERPQLPG
ncbi:MAG: response regulator [Halobacteriales archaeon]|nr:response regulator [Halobacteriales archaeon]